jgi:glycine/D-amino acid oxidase-like deaminating enzyme/nitrite reductase/ring-hydroxylating ferredoxin subunit
MPAYPALAEDTRADVCIVGAGIAGITTAYELVRAGKRVVVLERGELAGGATGLTTAHLASALDDRFDELERLHGEQGARLAAESHTAAIDRIEAIVAAERIACDFERLDGYLFAPPGGDRGLLERELEAARRAGLAGVERVDRAPLPLFDTGPCIRFPRQAQFHPLKYLAAVAEAIERGGGRIFAQTTVREIEGGEPARIEAGDHLVTAEAVVVATNTPINDLVAMHTKQAPYMTYVIGARIPRGAVPSALYWDTEDPYHYVRLYGDGGGAAAFDILIVGGEDHKSGQAEDAPERFAHLESWARERFPQIDEIAYTWAGQVMESIDGLAFIGRNPMDEDNVFIVTGDSGMGMTHGTIAAMLLTDLILGRENRWAELYDPSRKTVAAGGRFARETANMAGQLGAWVTAGDVRSVDEIAPDSGAVIRRGLRKLAVYRDAEGALHERSAVCPHLGCIVQWNAAAKTWDCPCHGSRFDPLGEVINGPAIGGLPRLDRA